MRLPEGRLGQALAPAPDHAFDLLVREVALEEAHRGVVLGEDRPAIHPLAVEYSADAVAEAGDIESHDVVLISEDDARVGVGAVRAHQPEGLQRVVGHGADGKRVHQLRLEHGEGERTAIRLERVEGDVGSREDQATYPR